VTAGAVRPGAIRRALPLVLLALAVGWTALLHYGLGPRPELGLHWWSPRGFLTRALVGTSWETLIADRSAGFAAFWTPVLVLAAATWLTTRSALMRAAAVTAVLASAMFLFYALGAGITQVAWNLFHWRASATMLAVAAVIACALVSPWLAARWLELGWPARVAWFVPVAFVVLAIERNVTGTNARLPFAISPWPAVQVFALETVGSTIASLLAGIGLGLFGLSRLRARRAPALGLLALAAGLALPLGWLWLGSSGLLPMRAGRPLYVGAGLLTIAGLAAAAVRPWRRGAPALERRALSAVTAALLLGLPLLAGEAWARLDYSRTRDVYAQRIIDALQKYYARESLYPETLDALVEAGDLPAVPQPSIGFRFLDDTGFSYQAFGTSYLLEFAAPRWVQCAYNPPYSDDGEGAPADGAAPATGGASSPLSAAAAPTTRGDSGQPEVAAGGGSEPSGDSLGGAWSCPQSPPELW